MNLHASNANSLSLPAENTSSSSSLRIVPATRVPVTTVPKPFMVNTRSMGSRASAAEFFAVNFGGDLGERGFQLIQTCAGQRAHGDYRRLRRIEKRSAHIIFHFQPHHFERLRIDSIGFGEHGDAALDRQQAADIEVFASLRLDPFIGGNYEQHQVDAAHARQHVAHKALVTGDIDEAQPNPAAIGSGEFEVGKPNVNRDAAPFFFFEAVGINAGQGFHQRRLPVIDMSGRADDDGLHLRQYRRLCGRTLLSAAFDPGLI